MAERLSKTVGELEGRGALMTSRELTEWRMLDKIREEMRRDAELDAKGKAALGRMGRR